MKYYLHILLYWLLFLFLASAGGAFRIGVLQPALGVIAAEWVEGVVVITLFVWIIFQFVKHRIHFLTQGKVIALGLIWMGMTVAFEFLFFHYVTGHSWDELLANYRIDQGRIWVVVLLAVLISPAMPYRILRKTNSEK